MDAYNKRKRLCRLEGLELRLALSGSGFEIDSAMFSFLPDTYSIDEVAPLGVVESTPLKPSSPSEVIDPIELAPRELEQQAPFPEQEVDAFMDELGNIGDYTGAPGPGNANGLDFVNFGTPGGSDGVGDDGSPLNDGSSHDIGSGLPHDLGGNFQADRPNPLADFNALIDELNRHGMGDIPQGEGVTPLLNPRMTGSLVAGDTGEMGKPVRTPWGDDGGEGEEKSSGSEDTTVKYGTGPNQDGDKQTYYRTSDGQVYIDKDGDFVPDNGTLERNVDMMKVFGGTRVTTTNVNNSGIDVIEVNLHLPSGSSADGESEPRDFNELRMALSKHEHAVDDTAQDDPRILLLGNPIANTSSEAGNSNNTADHASGDLVNPVVGDVSGGDGGRYPIDFAPGFDGDIRPQKLQLSSAILKYWDVVDPDER